MRPRVSSSLGPRCRRHLAVSHSSCANRFQAVLLKRAWRSDHAARAADRSHTIRLESAITFKYQFLATAKALIQGDC